MCQPWNFLWWDVKGDSAKIDGLHVIYAGDDEEETRADRTTLLHTSHSEDDCPFIFLNHLDKKYD